jgi:elongation factor G
MSEAMPQCDPVLLEPILQVTMVVPSEYTSKLHAVISSRRGQILGFEPKAGWDGWDELKAYMPQSEVHDLIVEIRSLTLGVGTFEWAFDHLQELTGRLADRVVEARKAQLAG